MNTGIFQSLKKSLRSSFLYFSLESSSNNWLYRNRHSLIMVLRFCSLYEKVVSYVTCIHKDESQTQELQGHVSKGQSKRRWKSIIRHYAPMYINLTENSISVNSHQCTFQVDFTSGCNSFYQRKAFILLLLWISL